MKTKTLFTIATLIGATTFAQDIKVTSKQSVQAKADVKTPAPNQEANPNVKPQANSSIKINSETNSSVDPSAIRPVAQSAATNLSEPVIKTQKMAAAKTETGIQSATRTAAHAGQTGVAVKQQTAAKAAFHTEKIASTTGNTAAQVSQVKPNVKLKATTSNKLKTRPVSIKSQTATAGHLKLR